MACISDIAKGNFIRAYLIQDSFTLSDLQNQGIPDICGPLIPFADFINIQTSWNDSSLEDGSFSLTLFAPSAADSDFIWVLPSGAFVEGKTLNIAANSGELNGTTRTITLTSESFDQLEGVSPIDFIDKKLEGSLDFSQAVFTGTNSLIVNATAPGLNNLTQLIAPSGDVSLIRCDGNDITSLNVSPVTNWTGVASLEAQNNSTIGMDVFFNANVGQLNTIDLSDNAMTSDQVEKVFSDINALVFDVVARTINIDGTNAFVFENSDITDLQAKGYTINYNQAQPFETQWKTDNAGTSLNTQIEIPTIAAGVYDCLVKWGDGNQDTITTFDDPAWTHTYAAVGTYTVSIEGQFEGIQFNNGGDRLKLLSIDTWGTFFKMGSSGGNFYGCSNLQITATDIQEILSTSTSIQDMFRDCTSIASIPNLDLMDVSTIEVVNSCFNGATLFNQDLNSWQVNNVTGFQLMFFNASSFNGNITSWNVSGSSIFTQMFQGASAFNQNIGGWNVSNSNQFGGMFRDATSFNQNISTWVTSSALDFGNMFNGATSFNQNIGGWNTSLCLSFASMFNGATAFDQDLGGWNVTSLFNAFNMFNGVTLSTANYDALLIGWSAQSVNSSVNFNAGNSQYTSGGAAETARDTLTNAPNNWTITDGGPV